MSENRGRGAAVTTTRLTLTPPGPFDFGRTARSHGWVVLSPNTWDAERNLLGRVQRLGSGRVVRLTVGGAGSVGEPEIDITVRSLGALTADEADEVARTVSHMLRLDEDLAEFYQLCQERGGPWRRATAGLGRLLRSPTLFEDMVKTICTTNIAWGGTLRMVSGLVDALGDPCPGDPTGRTFPTPEAVASAPREILTDTVRLGYRAEYVHVLAQRVVCGELDLGTLEDPELPTAELAKRLRAIKGVGAYATATLLMLLGRYDRLAVDTEFRQFVATKYFCGSQPTDREAQAVYEEWGRWKYLAYWFDRAGS